MEIRGLYSGQVCAAEIRLVQGLVAGRRAAGITLGGSADGGDPLADHGQVRKGRVMGRWCADIRVLGPRIHVVHVREAGVHVPVAFGQPAAADGGVDRLR